ncbi:hypothetical protein ACFSUS_28300 [Spirosoma soli]|uniref:Transposase n=1 Tax=Spirosoma soli TaxID=1770529 RepID=A0ABW5MEP1_9BACT
MNLTVIMNRTAEAAKETLERYFVHYNFHRLHRSIGFITPQQKWEGTEVVYATTFSENLSN